MSALIYQVSDRSQSQCAALRAGLWREHLRGSAASVSDHPGGGGLGWTGPRSLHSGLEVMSCIIWAYSALPWVRLTAILCSPHVFPQFFIYGGYFALISLVFFLAGLCKVFSRGRSVQVAMENSPAAVETDAPPISGSESCVETNATSVHVNGHFPSQQRWTRELQVNPIHYLSNESVEFMTFPMFQHTSWWICNGLTYRKVGSY